MSDPSPTTDIESVGLSTDTRQGSTGAWLDKRSACAFLGVVEKTIERRVARGEIPRQLVNGRVLLWIDGATSDMSLDTRQEAPQDARSVTLAVLKEQQALMSHASDLARQEQAPLIERIAEQAEEIGRLHEVERELRAELARLAVSSDVSDRRPWWRRLLS